MRNRFYSDLRTQRRRPASIDSDTAPMLTAVDNPEATLALKELSSACSTSARSRAKHSCWSAPAAFLRGGGSAVRLLGRHAQGACFARAQAAVRKLG
jgi:hypothetical protein